MDLENKLRKAKRKVEKLADFLDSKDDEIEELRHENEDLRV